jgi:L-threonylcarbamoyladenylate synthase
MKYRHYAPQTPLFLLLAETSPGELVVVLQEKHSQGVSVGVLASYALLSVLPETVFKLGSWYGEDDYPGVAAHLYGWLREFDRREVAFIIAQPLKDYGLGRAINNRLVKAAGGKIFAL